MLLANDPQKVHVNQQAEDQGLAPTPVQYTAEEIVQNFQALLESLDFKNELSELGIGSMQVLRRKKTLRELRALSIALWGLALQKSFPNDAGEFFVHYAETDPVLTAKGRGPQQLRQRLEEYIQLLDVKKEKDFLPIAGHLAEKITIKSKDLPRTRLKLSLIIRNLYNLVFSKLV